MVSSAQFVRKLLEPEEKQDVMWNLFTLNIVLLTFVTTVARNSILSIQEMFIFQEIIRGLINKIGSIRKGLF